MGTIAASVILNRASQTLIDETGGTWSPSEMLGHLNAGISATVSHKPDTSTLTEYVTLVAGPVQYLPAAGTQFLDALANGEGKVVFVKPRNDIDHSDPEWYSATPTANFRHVMVDNRDPRRFLVHPPATAGAELLCCYAVAPTRLTAPTDIFPLPDIYESALHAWVVGYALAKTSKRGDMARAQVWLSQWANSLGVHAQVQQLIMPMPPEETPTSINTAGAL